MIIPQTSIHINAENKGNGNYRVYATRGTETLHADSGDLASASFRQSFRDKLCEVFPGIQCDQVEQIDNRLLALSTCPPAKSASTSSKKKRSRVNSPDTFPLDALPMSVRGFVMTASTSIGCAPEFLVLPVLAALAASIGNSRRILIKEGWSEPAILWTVIVGDSGTQKTPAFEKAIKPLKDIQGERWAEYMQAMQVYERQVLAYKAELSDWNKAKDRSGLPPEPPEEPKLSRVTLSDVTVEALAGILADNPRGLMLDRDELAGWIGSFDRYSSRGGADAAHWLSIYNGSSFQVDRKTGSRTSLFVPSPALSICGGIQPGVLARSLGNEHFENGLAARLLLCMPDRKAKKWTDEVLPDEVMATYRVIIENLLSLHMPLNENDYPAPRLVTMSPPAKEKWKEFYDKHAAEMAELTGPLAAAWAKLEATVARMALILHLAEWAGNTSQVDTNLIEEATVEAAIKIINWCKGETIRVYAAMGETEDDRQMRALCDQIAKRGGEISLHDLNRSLRQYRGPDGLAAAEEDLNNLVEAGYGEWHYTQSGVKGGRPSRFFRLNQDDQPDPLAAAPSTNGQGSGGITAEQPAGSRELNGTVKDEADEPQEDPGQDGWEEVV